MKLEELSGHEDSAQPTSVFGKLINRIIYLSGQASFMGSYTSPALEAGGETVRLLAFAPNTGGESSAYEPSILWQSLVKKTLGEGTYLEPVGQIYVRLSALADGSGLGNLTKFAEKMAAYDQAATKLTARQASELGFSRDFVKQQSRLRRTGRALANVVRSALD